jgi:hypothetical protein
MGDVVGGAGISNRLDLSALDYAAPGMLTVGAAV